MTSSIRLVLAAALVLALASGAFAKDKLNLNSATAQELAAVPAIGPELAKRIVEHRSDLGDLKSLDELLEVKGVTPEMLDKIKEDVTVEAIEGNECSC